MTAHINLWLAYARKMECRRCGESIFHHEEDARESIEALIEAGCSEPTDLREYHSLCDYCDHVMSKDD